jgi:hypothetical protein
MKRAGSRGMLSSVNITIPFPLDRESGCCTLAALLFMTCRKTYLRVFLNVLVRGLFLIHVTKTVHIQKYGTSANLRT